MGNNVTYRDKMSPGTWSTDEYIRRWARNHGMSSGECVVPLQSLHGQWMARIDFGQAGEPVERIDSDALCESLA